MSKEIFISYRRHDTKCVAQFIYTALERKYSASSIYFDTESALPGDDFPRDIINAIKECVLFVVIIGEKWHLSSRDANRKIRFRRSSLFNIQDWIRRELELALRENKTIIPVLVEIDTLPRNKIPRSLNTQLGDFQLFKITPDDYYPDSIDLLIKLIDEKLGRIKPLSNPGYRVLIEAKNQGNKGLKKLLLYQFLERKFKLDDLDIKLLIDDLVSEKYLNKINNRFLITSKGLEKIKGG